jgi:hypothetical protein
VSDGQHDQFNVLLMPGLIDPRTRVDRSHVTEISGMSGTGVGNAEC